MAGVSGGPRGVVADTDGGGAPHPDHQQHTGDFAESETDLTRVRLLPSRFEALTRGYAETADFLVPGERKNLAFSGRLITFEIGIRFLTDYLLGDTYFRIHYPEENLVRARAQLRFVREMEDHASAMEGIVDRYAG